MIPVDLGGQKAIVTGASTGIGREVAVWLARAGCDVAVHFAFNQAEAEETARRAGECGHRVVLVSGDFRRDEGPRAAIDEAAAGLGGQVDILVNNAGSLIARKPLDEMDAQLWREVINLNLSSVFLATQAASPHFVDGARVVNVTSLAAHSGGGQHAFAYAAAKGGVISLTRGLAKELAPRSIRVNAISPGTIETPFHERFSTPEMMATTRSQLPLQRLGAPADCAAAVLYLVSPLSDFVTGEVVEINGGQWFA